MSQPATDPTEALHELLTSLEDAGVVNLYLHTPPFQDLEGATAAALRAAYAAVQRPVPEKFAKRS